MDVESAVTGETVPSGETGRPGGSARAFPRAETVGSLLRDDAVVRAARRSAPADNAILGDAVRDAIRLQEELGLDVITDGEARRVAWAQTPRFVDAFAVAGGQAAMNWRGATEGRFGAPASGAEGRSGGYPSVVRRVATAPRTGDMAAEYSLLIRYARSRTKFTMPAPSYHRRYWSPTASPGAGYSSPEEFLTEIRDYLRSVAHTLIDLGCDYIQLDAPNYGSLCDPDTIAAMQAGRPGPGGGARVRRRPRQLPVRRAYRGDLGAARLPRQRAVRRLALGGRVRGDLGAPVPAADGGPAAA